jgi:hypothetical protein
MGKSCQDVGILANIIVSRFFVGRDANKPAKQILLL